MEETKPKLYCTQGDYGVNSEPNKEAAAKDGAEVPVTDPGDYGKTEETAVPIPVVGEPNPPEDTP
jgi:hypothetical protein